MTSPLQHVAIIMDGNGRWAQKRHHSRTYGHIRGAKVAKDMIQVAREIQLPYLTLFTFSHENWSRPQDEVNFLMRLFKKQLLKEQPQLIKNKIRFRCIGNLAALPKDLQKIIQYLSEETQTFNTLHLTLAISYGGQQEILEAAKKLALQALQGEISKQELLNLTENQFETFFQSSALPPPDLIIRTSGEMRLSNFFLWQAAYSELYITSKYWPDFTKEDFLEALEHFKKRHRRYGKTQEQVLPHVNVN
ncbi:MAG: di-trans,poly-cis-decaprenylcistransferase [Bdellovibrio sp.]|nr:MAG: di-trans,poly-cis-decaprenylcistransferase [Bdellovibrio sp.]